ncbi:MAG: hypothetical protein ACRD2J_11025 [Thermoanaerobaculia bacterium]
MSRISILRTFLAVEGATFVVAAMIHFGVLVAGWEHRAAGIAESVIGIVLLAALALTAVRPSWTRGLALVAQGFALLGTIVGIVTIVIGIGPRTTPDIVYHVAIVIVLVWGLVAAARRPS